MYHRYGRYGSGAWKRRRQSKFVQRLPAVVPTMAIVRVQVPISTERIILIIMSDNEMTDYQENGGNQLDGSQTGRYPALYTQSISLEEPRARIDPPKPLSSWQKFADRKAVLDAQRLKNRIGKGQYIFLDSEELIRRISDFAEDDITNDLLQNESTPVYEVLHEQYTQAYLKKFEEMIRSFVGDKIIYLRDDNEKKLREALSKDREQIKTRSFSNGQAHDLVLLRILQIYHGDQLAAVDTDSLLKYAALLKRYEAFVLDFAEENEVVWPEGGSFRP